MSKVKDFNRLELGALSFYLVSGVMLMVSLALTTAPQLGLLGILSLISVYGILTQRRWTSWLLVVLLLGVTTFSLYTLAVAGFSNALLGAAMIVYAVLAWLATGYLLLRKTPITR